MSKKTFGFLLLVGAGASLGMMMHAQNKSERTTMRVLLVGDFKLPLAPENISTVALYHTHYNLWDTLIRPRKQFGIAKTFQLSADQRDYTFKLDPEARFSNGRPIKASDIRFSLSRLIDKVEGGHISAKTVIQEILTPDDATVVVRLKKPTPSFRFLLSTPELGIVPPEACDKAGNVVNLEITSGAYTVASINEKAQEITLKANPHFRPAEADAPKVVTIAFTRDDKRLTGDVVAGRMDFSEVIGMSPSGLKELSAHAEKASYKYTTPAVTAVLSPNPKTLNSDARKYLAALFQEGFKYADNQPIEVRSNQFLPPKTFGSLEEAEIPKITAKKVPLPSPLVIRVFGAGRDLAERASAFLKSRGIETQLADRSAPEDTAHLDARAQGMNSDFPEIELHLAAVSRYAWMKSASDELKSKVDRAFGLENDGQREALLKEISRDILLSGDVIPLTARTYVHIYDPKRVSVEALVDYDGDIPLDRFKMVK